AERDVRHLKARLAERTILTHARFRPPGALRGGPWRVTDQEELRLVLAAGDTASHRSGESPFEYVAARYAGAALSRRCAHGRPPRGWPQLSTSLAGCVATVTAELAARASPLPSLTAADVPD